MKSTLAQIKPRYDGLKVTREEYLDLEEDGFKYDMIDGVLKLSPSAFTKHGRIQSRLAYLVESYLDTNRIAQVFIEVDIFLPDAGDVLCPDISVVLNDNSGILKEHIHGVPDMVIEKLSKRTRKRDLGVKADRYLSNGVKEYWIADPSRQTIEIWINAEKKNWEKKEGDVLESKVLYGLILRKDNIFI